MHNGGASEVLAVDRKQSGNQITEKRRQAIDAFLLLLLVFLAFLPSLFWMIEGRLPDALLTEGGYYEHGSALASFIAGLVFAWSAWVSESRLQTFWLSALATGCFFLAGEEISWGQHLFNFEPPAIVAENNFQGEFNVHNLTTIQESNNAISKWLFRALMTYLIIVPMTIAAFPSIARVVRACSVPVPSAAVALSALLIKAGDLLNHEIIYGISFASDKFRVGEVVESLYQVCILWVAVSQAEKVSPK